MRVIFALNTPVLPEESRFQVGTAHDEYRFERQWLVPIKPRVEMEEGDLPSDWAVVSKILTAVSWNMRMDVSLRKTSEGNSLEACMPMREGSYSQLKGLFLLLGKVLYQTTPLLKIKLGNSNCIQFAGFHYDVDDEAASRLQASCVNKKLTEIEALKLLMTEDKDVQISWVESFFTRWLCPVGTSARLLDLGCFADCHLVSNQDQDSPCHQVILKENCAKFEEKIVSGNTKIKVDLSTPGVRALLRFLYLGPLDDYDVSWNWELSLELLKVANFLEIRKLWDAIVDNLREMEEPEMKTAVEVFRILVNSGKLETNKDLARKLVRLLSKKSTEAVGDGAILHEYIRDRAFFDAWIGFTSTF